MREVCENPSSVLHYVLLCKDKEPQTNTSPNLPLVLSSLLQEFQDVFPDELVPGLPPLRGIEHRIDLIPGAHAKATVSFWHKNDRDDTRAQTFTHMSMVYEMLYLPLYFFGFFGVDTVWCLVR